MVTWPINADMLSQVLMNMHQNQRMTIRRAFLIFFLSNWKLSTCFLVLTPWLARWVIPQMHHLIKILDFCWEITRNWTGLLNFAHFCLSDCRDIIGFSSSCRNNCWSVSHILYGFIEGTRFGYVEKNLPVLIMSKLTFFFLFSCCLRHWYPQYSWTFTLWVWINCSMLK